MHSSVFKQEPTNRIQDESEVLVALTTLVTEGRIPGPGPEGKGFFEGPHCPSITGISLHNHCNPKRPSCRKYRINRETVLKSVSQSVPICIEVFFTCQCKQFNNNETDNLDNAFLLEQWHFDIRPKSGTSNSCFNKNQLTTAIRSQLYFSQITAWLTTQDKCRSEITPENIKYRLTTPKGLLAPIQFSLTASKHVFPAAEIANGTLTVSFMSAPRISSMPTFDCVECSSSSVRSETFKSKMDFQNGLLDDRMHTSCTLKGKHCCDEIEDNDNLNGMEKDICSNKRTCRFNSRNSEHIDIFKASTSISQNISKLNNERSSKFENHSESKMDIERHNAWLCRNRNDLNPVQDKGQLLLDAIERSGRKNFKNESHLASTNNWPIQSVCDNFNCDMSESDKLVSNKERINFNVYVDKNCDNPVIKKQQTKLRDLSNVAVENLISKRNGARKRISFDNGEVDKQDSDSNDSAINFHSTNSCDLPTTCEHTKQRGHVGSATSIAFHERTGLPLTSSPAPIRKGKNRFDFDSTLNSVTAIKSALFSNSFGIEDESESDGSIISPCSPEIYIGSKKPLGPALYRRKGQSSNLLGSFEESILNGRLEPVCTVDGFSAKLGATGSFDPKHIFVPVSVFFYALGDHDKVSTPYLARISLGKKAYHIPKSGKLQVSLFNSVGSLVKMFLVVYNLSDMPPNSKTFIRQRELHLPVDSEDEILKEGSKLLRFLIHLRFMSSKSGKIYLHGDIRMIIMRKSDMDTATAYTVDKNYKLHTFIQQPSNPRYSPRK